MPALFATPKIKNRRIRGALYALGHPRLLHYLLGTLLISYALSTPANEVVTDGSGQIVQLKQPAQRIISLAPHITENLFSAGAGPKIVGTVAYSDYPRMAQHIPRVGGHAQLDLEHILALRPDLIIAWDSGNSAAQVQNLRRLGLPVYVSRIQKLADIAQEIQNFGILTHNPGASETAQKFQRDLKQLKLRYAEQAKQAPVRVFYQLWRQPLLSIGGPQIISELIELCGGHNVFATTRTMTPAVSIEAVITANPEVIIASDTPPALDEWQRWRNIDAVQHQHLVFIPADILQRQSLRLLTGAQQLCSALENVRTAKTRRSQTPRTD